MVEELRRLVASRASGISGLMAVVISDRDGVPVIKAPVYDNSAVVDQCLRHQFLSIFNTMTEHVTKMGFGETQNVLASFDDYQVVHCDHSPLVLTMIAQEDALTGELLNFSQSMSPLIKDIAKAVVVE